MPERAARINISGGARADVGRHVSGHPPAAGLRGVIPAMSRRGSFPGSDGNEKSAATGPAPPGSRVGRESRSGPAASRPVDFPGAHRGRAGRRPRHLTGRVGSLPEFSARVIDVPAEILPREGPHGAGFTGVRSRSGAGPPPRFLCSSGHKIPGKDIDLPGKSRYKGSLGQEWNAGGTQSRRLRPGSLHEVRTRITSQDRIFWRKGMGPGPRFQGAGSLRKGGMRCCVFGPAWSSSVF